MIAILFLCNLAFVVVFICAYVNICNGLEWISLKDLFDVTKDAFIDADSGVEAAMVVFALLLLPSILVSCLVIHIIYKSFSK